MAPCLYQYPRCPQVLKFTMPCLESKYVPCHNGQRSSVLSSWWLRHHIYDVGLCIPSQRSSVHDVLSSSRGFQHHSISWHGFMHAVSPVCSFPSSDAFALEVFSLFNSRRYNRTGWLGVNLTSSYLLLFLNSDEFASNNFGLVVNE